MAENKDFERFQDLLDSAKSQLNSSDVSEVKKELPKQDNRKYGAALVVSLNDIALTSDGMLTKTAFFENLNIDKEIYGDIKLTAEEAKSLAVQMKNMTTGVNSVVPLRCVADSCPFKDTCWFFENDKAPVGKPCPIEFQLLKYHTQRFIEEFNCDVNDHSEVLLIQELSELIVYEMRVTKKLANDATDLKGVVIKFSPDGIPMEEETVHWAWTLKDSIKSRRMKILQSLNATRKEKAAINKNIPQNDPIKEQLNSYATIRDIMKEIRNNEIGYSEAKYEPIEE